MSEPTLPKPQKLAPPAKKNRPPPPAPAAPKATPAPEARPTRGFLDTLLYEDD